MIIQPGGKCSRWHPPLLRSDFIIVKKGENGRETLVVQYIPKGWDEAAEKKREGLELILLY